jgi:hypothetical protein
MFPDSKSRKKWQKTFIDNVFSHKSANVGTFSRIILYNTYLLKDKNSHLPKSLFKFYSPTAENIIDIKKQRLWLSHPKTFNDPFDCHTGYDVESYEKHTLLKYIKQVGCVDLKNSQNGFTNDEFDRLSSSTTSHEYNGFHPIEEYDTALWKMLESKSEDFKHKIHVLNAESRNEVETKIEKLRDVNIRIVCFSALDRRKNFNDIIHIWSHYADSHKGYCVEYDISPLKESSFSLKEYDFLKDQYMEERIKMLILGGLFPVIYTANRVNIPKTKLNKIKLDEIGGPQHNSDIDSILYKTFIVKSAKWSYEKEWRLILDGDVCNYYDNKIPFPYIKRIFLGCKMNTYTIDTMIEIAEELGVEVIMMEMDNKKFILKENSTRWHKWYKEDKRRHNRLL